jgi:hypothetical protein
MVAVAYVVDIPVTMPVDIPTEATAGLLLLQVPPMVASSSVVVRPEHTARVPLIAAGSGSTVTTAVVIQPEPSE